MAAEGVPQVAFLPAIMRRRLSRLSKMALHVAYECWPVAEPVRTVFASRHGDVAIACGLLEAIVRGEPLSPTAFSMSVHNTASGYYSIARADKSASSALAAGADTLEAGFLDAASMLCAGRAQQVMLVCADDRLPACFSSYCNEPTVPYAVALLLSAPTEGGVSLGLELGEQPSAVQVGEPHALSLLRMLLQGRSGLVLSSPRISWHWSSDGGTV